MSDDFNFKFYGLSISANGKNAIGKAFIVSIIGVFAISTIACIVWVGGWAKIGAFFS